MKTKILAPSLLSADFANLKGAIEKIENNNGSAVHIDVMDGSFVPEITYGQPVIRSIRKLTDLPFDVHLMVEKPESQIDSFIKASRGQDVYINANTLEYNANSGIETSTIHTSNITLRDQTSDSLSRGGSGAVVLDIRPAGTSLLPDAYVSTIDNTGFEILATPSADDSKTVSCRAIISSLDGVYNQHSLAQYIICQYVYWQRLEKRIDIKQCLLAGNSGCN